MRLKDEDDLRIIYLFLVSHLGAAAHIDVAYNCPEGIKLTDRDGKLFLFAGDKRKNMKVTWDVPYIATEKPNYMRPGIFEPSSPGLQLLFTRI